MVLVDVGLLTWHKKNEDSSLTRRFFACKMPGAKNKGLSMKQVGMYQVGDPGFESKETFSINFQTFDY